MDFSTSHPDSLQKIKALEGKAPEQRDEPEKHFERPVFTQPLSGPTEILEAENAHFECRVVPVGDPNLELHWFVNGKELQTGNSKFSFLS